MNRLKELRIEHNLLQKDIAKEIGISQRNYSYYETNTSLLTSELLKKFANFYNTSIDYIVYETDERMPYPKK